MVWSYVKEILIADDLGNSIELLTTPTDDHDDILASTTGEEARVSPEGESANSLMAPPPTHPQHSSRKRFNLTFLKDKINIIFMPVTEGLVVQIELYLSCKLNLFVRYNLKTQTKIKRNSSYVSSLGRKPEDDTTSSTEELMLNSKSKSMSKTSSSVVTLVWSV